MSNLQAVLPAPGRGATVHLYLPGFELRKGRSLDVSSMCGVACNESTPPPVGPRPTGRKWIPIDAAADYIRRAEGGEWPLIALRWCAPCIGRAVEHYGLAVAVMGMVADLAAVTERGDS